ncbi:uridine kinase [Microbacteriaceae bacterium SG_E_30_P1]|uniref:Uridine kinase n=1 Tax=Antiquaquibacter oligotrophicus TaxID=2880260 RepID=A0ABT6KL68_9MICO|nr:uridine kinase [Antiquaquibacter oligotrophicus]MDH6180604.1 uridine kinase [Antiquaquibacter oligotrophicus]UDF13663.1 uridine kinase [Antiquaquibacter oligotrophicus]
MPLWSADKRAFFDSLADEFLGFYTRGRTLLSVDGLDGSCRAAFADALAERLGRNGHAVFRASIDDFLRPKSERLVRGVDSAEGYYQDSYDYDQFRRVLIEPFRLGGSAGFVTAAFDAQRDTPVVMEWKTGPQDATLIVDGPFLGRPELRGLWHFSVWLDVDVDKARERCATVDGAAPRSERYAGGERLYLAEANPRTRASAIVDNTDAERPRRIFADSC